MLETIGATGVYAIIGVITLAIASLVGLVLFVSKEETFEDVVAAQKKEQEALLSSLQSTSKSGKSSKKWKQLKNKKASKKENEDSAEVDSGVDDDEPSIESVVTAPPPPIKKEEEGKHSSKKSGKKTISGVAPLETTDEVQKPKQEKPKKSKKPKKIIVEDVISQSEEVVVEAVQSGPVEEIIIVSADEITVSAPPPNIIATKPQLTKEPSQKKSKSTKNKQAKNVVKTKEALGPIVSISKMVEDIEACQLNSGQLQEVIDAILAKQSENEQWRKPHQKGDPIEQMKKQVSELNAQLMDERKNSQTFVQQYKEVRSELQLERHQKQTLQAQVGNRLTQQVKEHESTRKRLEEKHVSEMQSAQAQIQRMQQLIDGASNIEIQHLKEENNILKNASMRAQQLSEDKKSLMNELSQLQQGNKQLRNDVENSRMQYQQIEQQIKNAQRAKSEAESALTQRLQEVNEQLIKVEAQNRSLSHELQQSQNANASTLATVSDNSKVTETDLKLKELVAQLESKSQELLKCQATLDDTTKVISNKDVAYNTAVNTLGQKDQEIVNLTTRIADIEKEKLQIQNSVSTSPVSSNQESDEKIKKLESEVAAKKKSEDLLSETIDNLKKKNNELREKNWKAVDALGKAEEDSEKKAKELGKHLMGGLKRLHPDVKIPSYDGSLVEFMKSYEENYQDSAQKSLTELQEVQQENKTLKNELEQSKSNQQAPAEAKKIESENAHLKNVLSETESMLSHLQAGVDAEVAKWQKKVEEKNHEILESNKKVAELEEVLKSQGDNGLDTELKTIKEQLQSVKKELEEKQSSSETELNDLNSKLKKTISERDLLIREHKTLKDKNGKSDSELKKAKEEQEKEKKELANNHAKEMKKLKDQLTALENTSKTSGKGDKEKDEVIAELHKQVESLTSEKENLSVKLNDLEKSVQEEQGDKDKVMNLESKLKAAEAKIQELESVQNNKIQNEIEDAMQHAASTNGANVGTSV